MPLTKDFRETVKSRAERDRAFRNALLTEALEAIVSGELDIAKTSLRHCYEITSMQRKDLRPLVERLKFRVKA